MPIYSTVLLYSRTYKALILGMHAQLLPNSQTLRFILNDNSWLWLRQRNCPSAEFRSSINRCMILLELLRVAILFAGLPDRIHFIEEFRILRLNCFVMLCL